MVWPETETMISKVETCESFCYCLDILTAIMCYSGRDFSFIQCPQNHNAVSNARFMQCRCGRTGRFYRWHIHCQPLNSPLLDEHSCSIYMLGRPHQLVLYCMLHIWVFQTHFSLQHHATVPQISHCCYHRWMQYRSSVNCDCREFLCILSNSLFCFIQLLLQ